MTQPAKVQEPSMEEILASIRRIIADDEAKPVAAEKPPSPTPTPAKPEKSAAVPPAAKSGVMHDIPPSAIPATQVSPKPAVARPAPARAAPPPAAPAPPAAATNSQ